MEAQEAFESHLMGGIDAAQGFQRSTVSYAFWYDEPADCNYLAIDHYCVRTVIWVDGDNSKIHAFTWSTVLGLTACVALVIETFLADERLS